MICFKLKRKIPRRTIAKRNQIMGNLFLVVLFSDRNFSVISHAASSQLNLETARITSQERTEKW